MLLESQPLGIGPVPPVPTRLLRQLKTIGAGVERNGLAGRGAVDSSRVDGHRIGHLMGRQGDRVVLYAALITKHHPVIVRGLSRESSPRAPRDASGRLGVAVDQNEPAVGQRSTGSTRTGHPDGPFDIQPGMTKDWDDDVPRFTRQSRRGFGRPRDWVGWDLPLYGAPSKEVIL